MAGLGNIFITEDPVGPASEEEEAFEANIRRWECDRDLWTTVQLEWQLLKRDLRQMNMKPTQKMTFMIGRTKILRSQFQDLGGQYAHFRPDLYGTAY